MTRLACLVLAAGASVAAASPSDVTIPSASEVDPQRGWLGGIGGDMLEVTDIGGRRFFGGGLQVVAGAHLRDLTLAVEGEASGLAGTGDTAGSLGSADPRANIERIGIEARLMVSHSSDLWRRRRHQRSGAYVEVSPAIDRVRVEPLPAFARGDVALGIGYQMNEYNLRQRDTSIVSVGIRLTIAGGAPGAVEYLVQCGAQPCVVVPARVDLGFGFQVSLRLGG